MKHCVLALLALTIAVSVKAAPPVAPKHRHERIIAVVPMVGAGTYQDPKRPLFAPLSGELGKPGKIHEFSYQLSDDGQYALVEFVALDKEAFKTITTDARVQKLFEKFEKGKHKKSDIDKELKKFKKDFDIEKALGSIVGAPVANTPGAAN